MGSNIPYRGNDTTMHTVRTDIEEQSCHGNFRQARVKYFSATDTLESLLIGKHLEHRLRPFIFNSFNDHKFNI